MKFTAKFLRKTGAAGVVYVVLESDRPINAKNPGDPIGVVSSEQAANLFYQRDSKHRDIRRFVLDELPELTGIPGTAIPPSSSREDRESIESIQESTKLVNESNKKIRELMEKFNAHQKK